MAQNHDPPHIGFDSKGKSHKLISHENKKGHKGDRRWELHGKPRDIGKT